MATRSVADADALRALVQRFVRAFGLLGEAETPCGQPLRTSHAHALMILLDADGGMHQAVLARALGIDKSNASRLLRQLVDEGHVVMTPAPEEDARIKRVRLTAKGYRLAERVDKFSRARFAEVLGAVERPALAVRGLEELTRAVERVQGERKRA